MDTGAELARQEHNVPRGPYGPYTPFYTGTDYKYKEWLSTSDPPQGIINAGATKTIVFLYEKSDINIKVNVVWDDFDNKHNTRPTSIGINLFQNANPVPINTIWIPSNVNQGSFTVPVTDAAGTPYSYTIGLVSPLDEYGTAITGSATGGFTVTNMLKRLMNIEVTVNWEDFNNVLNRRPTTITVGIFRNGAPFQMKNAPVVILGNQQKVVFENVEKYDAAGNLYTFTVVQQPLNNSYYTTTITGRVIVNQLII